MRGLTTRGHQPRQGFGFFRRDMTQATAAIAVAMRPMILFIAAP